MQLENTLKDVCAQMKQVVAEREKQGTQNITTNMSERGQTEKARDVCDGDGSKTHSEPVMYVSSDGSKIHSNRNCQHIRNSLKVAKWEICTVCSSHVRSVCMRTQHKTD